MTTHPNRRAVMAGAAALMIPAVARAQSMRVLFGLGGSACALSSTSGGK